MAVARITEISSSSKKSMEHAVEKGVSRASRTLDNVKGAWVDGIKVKVEDGKVVEWRVALKVSFVLKD